MRKEKTNVFKILNGCFKERNIEGNPKNTKVESKKFALIVRRNVVEMIASKTRIKKSFFITFLVYQIMLFITYIRLAYVRWLRCMWCFVTYSYSRVFDTATRAEILVPKSYSKRVPLPFFACFNPRKILFSSDFNSSVLLSITVSLNPLKNTLGPVPTILYILSSTNTA